ncbi:MAG: hypothetical protein RLZZ248_1974 [Bacteroidota bacterium]|jgi:hypothetical protein
MPTRKKLYFYVIITEWLFSILGKLTEKWIQF